MQPEAKRAALLQVHQDDTDLRVHNRVVDVGKRDDHLHAVDRGASVLRDGLHQHRVAQQKGGLQTTAELVTTHTCDTQQAPRSALLSFGGAMATAKRPHSPASPSSLSAPDAVTRPTENSTVHT